MGRFPFVLLQFAWWAVPLIVFPDNSNQEIAPNG
jgi:hypothetical protein